VIPSSVRVDDNLAPARRRWGLAAFTAYFVLLNWVYVNLIAPTWAYLGFTYAPISPAWLVTAYVFAVLPLAVMPMVIRRASDWLIASFYLMVYVPACSLPLFQRAAEGRPLDDHLPLLVTMLASVLALVASTSMPRMRRAIPKTTNRWFWAVIIAVWFATHALIFVRFSGQLAISGLNEVQEQRLNSRDVIGGRSILSYAINACLFSINPLLIGFGLARRKPHFFALGAVGELLIYSASAARAAGGVFLAVGLVVWLGRGGRHVTIARFAGSIAALLVAMVMLGAVASPAMQRDSQWLMFRVLVGPATTTDNYYEFFSTNPTTDFSHLTGLGWLGEVPYENGIARAVGQSSTGGQSNNENGNYLADGIAGAGLLGIVFTTAIAAAVLWVADSASSHHHPTLALPIIAAQSINFANVPTATMLVSGGLALTAVFLWSLPGSSGTARSAAGAFGVEAPNRTSL